MKIEVTQSELIVALAYYFNKVKFKDPVRVNAVHEQGNRQTTPIHVTVDVEMVIEADDETC